MEDLFISKVRVKLITLFLTTPDPLLHVREIVRRIDEEINAVRRELERMEKNGLLDSEWRANRKLYALRRDYPFYRELLGFVAKSEGLGGSILKNKGRLGRIKYAMMAIRFFKNNPSTSDDVDLLLVGQIIAPELNAIMANEQSKRENEINFTFMDEAEFNFRVRRRDPFILRVLTQAKIMIIGDEEEMLSGVLV